MYRYHRSWLLSYLPDISLKVSHCTAFWSFILGFDVLKNIYLGMGIVKVLTVLLLLPILLIDSVL